MNLLLSSTKRREKICTLLRHRDGNDLAFILKNNNKKKKKGERFCWQDVVATIPFTSAQANKRTRKEENKDKIRSRRRGRVRRSVCLPDEIVNGMKRVGVEGWRRFRGDRCEQSRWIDGRIHGFV